MTSQTVAQRARLVEDLSGLDEEDFVTVLERSLATRQEHASVRIDSSALVTLLRVTLQGDQHVARMAGGPRLVHDSVRDAFTDLAIRTQARRAVLDAPVLTSSAVAEALGLRGKNQREAASRLRQRGTLLGLPDTASRGYLYPAFQIDPLARRVHPVVEIVNTALRAAEDPWGVGSWWVSPTSRLDGLAPMDVVGSDIEDDLLVMVGALPPSAASDARTEVVYDETTQVRFGGEGPADDEARVAPAR